LLAALMILWTIRRKRQRQAALLPLLGLMALIITGALTYSSVRVSMARPTLVAGDLPPEQAQALLQVLLKNVYRAFDFRNEEDVYDKLAVSVSGDLLADIYLQNRRSFAVQQAGGAQAKIQSVEIQDAVAERLDDRPLAYAIRGNWTAQGTVGHWGHVHTRRNRYDAIVTVDAVDGTWKITDMEILEEQRIDPAFGSAAGTAAANPAAQAQQVQ